VNGDWRAERARVTRSFDAVADLYRVEFEGELDRKPFDRDLLDRVAPMFPAGRPVLEVGAGPGHIGAYLARRGAPVIVSDASPGQVLEARAGGAPGPLVLADLARLPARRATLGGIVAFYCLIYGPVGALDAVLADWRAALAPGGVVVIAVHAGAGERHVDEWHGRALDVTVVLRDPGDLAGRVERAGLGVTELVVRPPYPEESDTERCYVVARVRD